MPLKENSTIIIKVILPSNIINSFISSSALCSYSVYNSGSVGKCPNTYKLNIINCMFSYKLKKCLRKCLRFCRKNVLKNVGKMFKKMFNRVKKGGKN